MSSRRLPSTLDTHTHPPLTQYPPETLDSRVRLQPGGQHAVPEAPQVVQVDAGAAAPPPLAAAALRLLREQRGRRRRLGDVLARGDDGHHALPAAAAAAAAVVVVVAGEDAGRGRHGRRWDAGESHRASSEIIE